MTQFETVIQAEQFIEQYNGAETTINGALHFGVDIYIWKDEAIELGIEFKERQNALFVTPVSVLETLKSLMFRDKFLIAD